MNSAIIFVKSPRESELAEAMIFDKHLIDYTVRELKRIDIESIYLIGDLDVENVVRRNNIKEIIDELKGEKGKCIVTSPFYPLIRKNDYASLMDVNGAAAIVEENELIPVFSINNSDLANFDKIDYTAVSIEKSHLKKFTSLKDTYLFGDAIRNRTISKWLNKGVIITDPHNTIIGVDAVIDKGTVIESNVTIAGKTLIGKDNKIKSNSLLNNAVIGDNNVIDASRIEDSIVHNNVTIGPNACLNENSEVLNNASVGSYVKLISTKIGENTRIDHLTYLGDTYIGNNCNIGTGVSTVNYASRTRSTTVIKDKTTIGSNVTLIAPITIGERVLIAAGSTIDQDVQDGDMAIARIYQQNKKGLGYKYHKEG